MFSVVVLFVVLGLGQITPGAQQVDLGAPVEAYVLERGYLLTVARDPDGRIREMIIERANVAGSGNLILGENKIPDEVRERLLDRLVPARERGAKLPIPDFLRSDIGGGIVMTNYSYERVAVWEYSSYRGSSHTFLVITWPRPKAAPLSKLWF